MTQHRYPCPAEPPKLLLDPSPETQAIVGGRFGHQHACIHDAAIVNYWQAEHECECGMTRRVAPPDVSWVTMENADGDSKTFRRFILPIFAAVMIPLLVIGAVATWLVTR